MNIAFIVQARAGSTRLPGKMNMPFYKGQTILDIILSRLTINFPEIPVILATTVSDRDNTIVEAGYRNNVKIFRGDEENVLSRFVEAGKEFNVDHVIRICADNPFISVKYLGELIDFYKRVETDYASFISKSGLPAMKTHYGFFAEIISLKALVRTFEKTQDKFYCEHVTNFIYEHPQVFSLNFLQISSKIESADLRLTVDTLEDFEVCKKIYSYLVLKELNLDAEHIIKYINDNLDFSLTMKNQIYLNKK